MDAEKRQLNRRSLLRGSLATAALVPFGGALASCATGGDTGGGGESSGPKSDDNPFGMKDEGSIDAVIFNGGYGVDYVEFAADEVKKKFGGVTPKVTPSTQIAQQLQPRFVGGNPPDLIDNSGANQIGWGTILDQLEPLDDVFESTNYEGTKIADTLYDGVQDPGTFDGKFVAINYAMTVFGLWYSASLFEENGWTPPKTWDEAMELGAKAKEKKKYLFVFGKEAATYYQTLAIGGAIKEEGDQLRLDLENLKPKCWSAPAFQTIFKSLEEMVKKGYFVPGGAGTQFTAAQAKWSKSQQAILYPSGGWIENEMKKATAEDFQMTGVPELSVSDSGELPYEALHSSAGEPFCVPTKGKNKAGGKEILRAMLSNAAATNFSKTKLAPTIVKGTVPEDGFGSSALVSQSKMLDAAAENVFTYNFISLYGLNKDMLTVWNTFLSGKSDAKKLTEGLQGITDKVANDDSVKKIPVDK